jgi:integrase
LDPWFEETVRVLRVRQMAYRTEEAYLGWLRRMECFLGNEDGLEAFGEADLKRFLSFLAVEEGVAAGTQRQALNAGVFFLREVRKMELGDFSDYVKANPRKYFPVAHLQAVRTVHEADRAAGVPGVYMPGGLERKMARGAERWEWFWVFPMPNLSKDPRGAADAPKRRHHILPRAYQKELSAAAVKADIPKRSNSHVLRHSYATHLLESGTNIRTLQEFLGHTCVETTMIYLHVMEDQKDQTLSPLDGL